MWKQTRDGNGPLRVPLLPHFLSSRILTVSSSERRTRARKEERRSSMVILKMFSCNEDEEEESARWKKHQDVCLTILFSFRTKKNRDEVESASDTHFPNSHKRFLSRTPSDMTSRNLLHIPMRTEIVLSRLHFLLCLFRVQFIKLNLKPQRQSLERLETVIYQSHNDFKTGFSQKENRYLNGRIRWLGNRRKHHKLYQNVWRTSRTTLKRKLSLRFHDNMYTSPNIATFFKYFSRYFFRFLWKSQRQKRSRTIQDAIQLSLEVLKGHWQRVREDNELHEMRQLNFEYPTKRICWDPKKVKKCVYLRFKKNSS